MGYIMEKEELLPLLDSSDIKICDCRFRLGSPDAGFNEYQKTIFPVLFISILKKDLSGQVQEHGGRHPLPDLEMFKDKLESNGITNDTVLVAYDGEKVLLLQGLSGC